MAQQPVVWQAGRVVAVETEPQGSVVVGWTGNTLTLVNAADFPRDGGTFTVDGDPTVVYTFTDVTEGVDELAPDVVTTVETAPAGFAAERVNIFPPATDTYAMVELVSAADAVQATVTHALKAFLPDGVREPDQAEWVNIELRGTEWFVAEVIGRQPSITSATIDGLDAALADLDDALGQLDVAMGEARTGLDTLDAALTQAQADLASLDEALEPGSEALAHRITASLAAFQTVYANAITANMLNVDVALAQKLQATMATFQTVFANTLTANMIQADSFAGYSIAGANIYSPGSTSTPRTQIVGPTLSVVRSDTEGREFPTVQLGGSTADQVMLYDASGNPVAGFDSDGRGLASELMVSGDMTVGGITNVGQLLVNGTDVMEYITPLPRGVVARQKLGTTAAGNAVQFGNTWLGYYELFFDSYANRTIRVRYSGLVYCSQPGQYNFELRYTALPGYTGAPASPRPVAPVTGNQAALGRVMATSAAFYPIQLEAWFQPYGGRYRVLLSAQCQSSGMYGYLASHDNWPAWFVAEDMGSYVSFDDGGYNRGGGTPYSGTATETAPTTPKQTYTTTWDSAWNRSWRGGSVVTDGMLHQGYYGGAQRTSQVGFSSAVQTALSGATVSKLELYMENLSWYYGSGGKLRIGAHGNAAAGAEKTNSSPGPTDSATWVAGGKGWVTLPASWYTSFASGAYKGITLGEGAGTNMTYYGKFRNVLSAAKLRATYTK